MRTPNTADTKEEKPAGGMFVKGSEARVPLTGVAIEVKGSGAAARVTVRQRYVNQETVPVEAVYSFPLEEGSAVCELIVETGGRTLKGKIEEREKAFEQYDAAMAEGHGAVLADQDRPNIFTVSVGNLLPNQEATVQLTYATELAQSGDTVRLMLPTTISPRYVPAAMQKTADPAELERINPPTLLGAVPYGLRLKVEYTTTQGVKSVACPSHPAEVEISGNTARVELAGANVQLDRDFVMTVVLQQPFEAGAVVARDPSTADGDAAEAIANAGARAVMINLYPDLKKYRRGPCEFIFIVDRSGSMEGDSIAQARNALALALRSMDEGDRFNLVGFGNNVEMMFPESQSYNQQSLDEATKRLKNWGADLGGTEMLQPLTAALESPAKTGLPRQIMLLTDGQVGNDAACIALVEQHSGKARLFTFGIGHGASENLVRGLARAGGGQAEFIHPNERIEPKVLKQFARAASPFLKNVRLDWGGLVTELVTPVQLPSLFDGDRLTVYARVSGAIGAAKKDGRAEVAVLADGPDGALRFPVQVDLERAGDQAAVPVLMARTAIRELEEGRVPVGLGSNQTNRRKKTVPELVLALALRYQILSSQTSFIAVEERAAGTQTQRAELRRVPVALTHGWGGVDGVSVMKDLAPGGPMRSVVMGMAGGAGLGSAMPSPKMAAPMVPAPALAAAQQARSIGARMKMSQEKSDNARRRSEPVNDERSSKKQARGVMGKMMDAVFGSNAPASPAPDAGYDQDNAEYASAAEDRSKVEHDLLMALTQCQRADGSFRLTAPVLTGLHVDGAVVTAAVQAAGGGSAGEAIAHTALTLAVLEAQFGARADEWRMLADKAERWLAKQTAAVPGGHASWVAWARAVCKIG